MQRRRLGTDIDVSVLGLGTVKFGRTEGLKYPDAFALPSDTDILHLLDTAKELGINLLDTAPAYGTSEERLGHLLQGKRKDWIISTKVGEEFINGESHFDFKQASVIKSVERSLQRLKTDYLDCVLVHSSGDDVRIIQDENIFTVLADLKQAGKIRSFGMSTKTIAGGLLAVEHSDAVMVTLNPAYTEERDIIASAHEKQKAVFIKKAFASGHLHALQSADPITRAFQCVFAEPGVTSVIIGTINAKHLRQNVEKLLTVLA